MAPILPVWTFRTEPSILTGGSVSPAIPATAETRPAGVPVGSQSGSASTAAVPGRVLAGREADSPGPGDVGHPFAGRSISVQAGIVSATKRRYLFALTTQAGDVLELTDRQLFEAGYQVYPVSECVAKLSYGSWSYTAVCRGTARRAAERLVSERSGETGSASNLFAAASSIIEPSSVEPVAAEYVPRPLPR